MKHFKNLRFLTDFIALVLFLAAFGIYAPSADGEPAMPGVHAHVQKDGTVVYYQLHGDEFLSWMTDANGELVVFARDGDIYLARWLEEGETDSCSTVPTNVRPTGAALGSRPPALEAMLSLKIPIPARHLERARQARSERDREWREHNVLPVDAMAAPLVPRKVIERKVLMIYVSFADNGWLPSMQELKIPTSQTLYNFMFSEDTFGTVAHYYRTVTDGAVRIVPAATINTMNPGIVFVELPGQHGNWGRDYDNFRSQLVIQALNQAADRTNLGGYVNYSAFDTNRDGYITPDELSIGLIVHGYNTSTGGLNPAFPSVWPHASSRLDYYNNDVHITRYFAQGAYRDRIINFPLIYPANHPSMLPIMGTIAHELGHTAFGFIDLYDVGDLYGSDYYGVGMWSLMGRGSHGGNLRGSKPTALDAFHLYGGHGGEQLVAPQSVRSGTNTLIGLAQYVKLPTSDPDQYFLIQPRGNVGYDRGLPRIWDPSSFWTYANSGGLLILLVDNRITGSNRLTTDNRHYRVAVVPAGWAASPTLTYNTTGVPGDLFSAARPFINSISMPSSRIYATVSDSTPTVNSGWNINSISSSVTGLDSDGGTVSGSFFVSGMSPTIITMSLPRGIAGVPYSQTLMAIGGAGPVTWLVSGGKLPDGLNMCSSGVIYGTPETSGTFNFTVRAANAAGSATIPMSLIISAAASSAPQQVP